MDCADKCHCEGDKSMIRERWEEEEWSMTPALWSLWSSRTGLVLDIDKLSDADTCRCGAIFVDNAPSPYLDPACRTGLHKISDKCTVM